MRVAVSKNSKIFHHVGCGYLHGSTVSVKQAFEYETALGLGYLPCSRCSHSNKMVKNLRKDGFNSSWDRERDACCLRTDVGFWKTLYNNGKWVLYHQNNGGTKCFDPNKSTEELMNGAFHRQKDVAETKNFEDIVRYIGGHEHYIRVKQNDYRKLPKKYRDAEKKRRRRKGLREVRKLMKQLEKEHK